MSRIRSEQGFLLLEMLIVLSIMAVMTAVAVPAFGAWAIRQQQDENEANIRATIPAIETYRRDHSGYDGMSGPELRAIDQRVEGVFVIRADATTYCIATNTYVTKPVTAFYRTETRDVSQTPC